MAQGLHTPCSHLDSRLHLRASPNACALVRPRARTRAPRSLRRGPSTLLASCQPLHALKNQQEPALTGTRSLQQDSTSALPVAQAPFPQPAERVILAVRTAAALAAAVLLTPAAARANVCASMSGSPAVASVATHHRDSLQPCCSNVQQGSQQAACCQPVTLQNQQEPALIHAPFEHALDDELQQAQWRARSMSHSLASTSGSSRNTTTCTNRTPHASAGLSSRAAAPPLSARSALLASISSSVTTPAMSRDSPPSSHNQHQQTAAPRTSQLRPPQHSQHTLSGHNTLATTAAADAAPHPQQPPLPPNFSPSDAAGITGGSADPGAAPQQQLQQPSPAPPPDGLMLLTQMDAATHRLFKSAQPSVVNVSGARMATAFSTLDVTRPAPGQGSGFIWDGRGHVVTSYSLVRGAAEVKVTLVDASSYTARVVGWDAGKDVAVLRLSMPKSRLKELRPAKLPATPIAAAGVAGAVSGLSTTPEGVFVGQTVFGVGNMTGLDHTLTKGCVSGLGRELPGSSTSPAGVPLKGLIQIDAPCAHQSGGALLNAQGHVVGMVANSLGSGSRPAGCGLGYAVPIEAFRGLVDQIIAAPVSLGVGTARPSRPTLGVTLAPPQVLSALGQEGVLVLEVPPGSPGVAAGLRHTHRDIFGDVILGDVICGLDGKSVRNSADLFNALDGRRAGDRVRLDILRDNRATSLTVVLGERGAAGQLEE